MAAGLRDDLDIMRPAPGSALEIVLDRLFTHRWKLEQAKEAYELFDRQDAGKGVILPS